MTTPSGVIGSSRNGPAHGLTQTLGSSRSSSQVKSRTQSDEEGCVGDTKDSLLQSI